MKLLVLLLTIFSIKAFAYTGLRDWTVCEGNKCKEVKAGDDLYLKHNFKLEKATYKTTFSKNQINACLVQNDCWLYLGSVGDTVTVRLNKVIIGKYDQYIHFESLKFHIPTNLIEASNDLVVEVTDLNQTRFGLRSHDVGIGVHSEAGKKSSLDWLLRTGSPLLSAFTLFVLLLGLIATYVIYQNNKIIPLIGLSTISILYLLSFSELPRQHLDPIYMSGPVHFILRLSLDLALVFVSLSFYRPHQKISFIFKLPYLYALPILTMIISGLLGIHQYEFYKTTMLVIAPLVIGGGLSLSILSYYYFDQDERRLTLPLFTGLLGFQIYDLLVFWELINGRFTVNWYLPFLVITFAWLYVRRRILEVRTLKIDALVGDEVRKLSHDLMAPIKNLNSLLHLERTNGNELIKRNIEDIERITNQVLCKYQNKTSEATFNQDNNLSNILNDLSEKFEKQIKTSFSLSMEFDWYNVDSVLFYRVFTNLIANSINANATVFSVYGRYHNRCLEIDITDNGPGIPKKLQPYIFEKGVTSKKLSGNGLGLSYIKEKFIDLSYAITLLHSNINGTTFRIKLPLEEIILIDDNEIVRDTWQTLANKAGIRLKAFSNSTEFKSDIELKITPVFVDYYLGKENGVEVITKLKALGFINVFLATGESRQVEPNIPQVGKGFPKLNDFGASYGLF